ncbi:MAG: hypothetical protein ABSF34_02545, partial [Verrucomicrobiota bacterium]
CTNLVKTDSSAFICMVFMPPNLAHTLGHPQSMHLLSIQGLARKPKTTQKPFIFRHLPDR